MSISSDILYKLSGEAKDNFKKSQSILSFQEYLDEVLKYPKRHIRNSGQYFADILDYFGSYEINTPYGQLRRYKLFDAEFCEGEGKIFGQESSQEKIVNYIKNFVRLGKVDKLILLHGPNGSAKSSIVSALTLAAEHYSERDDGALYQFSWVFPKKDVQQGYLGFREAKEQKEDTYAYLNEEEIDAKIYSDERDHPLLLLEPKERELLWDKISQSIKIPENLKNGEMSHKSRQIYEALLYAYQGDLGAVLRHVQVERFYLSKKYRKGISAVEPQMSVDAGLKQISIDQSALSLPSSLRHVSLLEVFGPLVEASRGVIEYNDLLKRPIDAWKYLLVASEQSSVNIASMNLTFDLLMLASSNELHLSSFKEYPDWPSFRGRIELVRVPYLLRVSDEVGIYKNQIPKALNGLHIAPYAIEVAARFAVLTRLEAPNGDNYDQEVKDIILRLSPMEKLELYDQGLTPAYLTQRETKILKNQLPNIYREFYNHESYEGRFGASPREVKMVLLNAAQDKDFDHLAVTAVFKELSFLIEERSSFDFLRREPSRGYKDAALLLAAVKNYYHSVLEDEIRTALGLYGKDSYIDLFKRYILHVSAWIKKETLLDPVWQKKVEPDEKFMQSVEKDLRAKSENEEEFRRHLISQIGAFRLENPHKELDYNLLFYSHIKRLKDNLYKEQYLVIKRIMNAFLRLEENENEKLDEKDMHLAKSLKDGLYSMGYNDSSSKAAVSYLLSHEPPVEKNLWQEQFNF